MKQNKKTAIRKHLSGIAKADSKNNTVAVTVSYVNVHPIYLRRYQISRTILAHTEKEIKKGEKVIIEETKPLSKMKAWKVLTETK